MNILKRIRPTEWAVIGYCALAIAGVVAYPYAAWLINRHDAVVRVAVSPITVNFLLFLSMIGWQVDVIGKRRHWGTVKGWLIWAVVMLVVFLSFNILGGYKAIWNQ